MRKIFVYLIVLILVGCAGGGQLRKHRGKLSDGMQKAAEEEEKDRKVHTEYSWEYDNEDEPEIFIMHHEKADDENDITIQDVFERTRFVTRFSSGLKKSSDFYGSHDLSFGFSGEIVKRNFWSIFAEVEHSPIQSTSDLNESLQNGVTILKAGVQWDIHTTGDHTFLGNYFLFGGNIDFMTWEYRNPLIAWDDYGNEEEITSDWLQGMELYTGIGFTILNPYEFQVGLEIVPGIILWGWSTYEGFENDVFDPFPYLKLRMILNFEI